MFEQDLPRFALLIVSAGEVYNKTLTSAVIEIYWSVLRDFKFDEVKNAMRSHFANPDTGQYLPKPADIIMAIEGSTQSRALKAWSKANSAVKKIGIYTSVAFDDALIHVVIEDMGGWWKFCSVSDNHLPFVAREFQERYRGYITQKPARHPKYLTGITESQSSAHGYSCAPPILIGNQQEAQKVFDTGKYTGPLLEIDQLAEISVVSK